MYGYGFGYYLDPTMLIVLPGLLIALLAQWRISATFRKYSQVNAQRGLPASEVARELLLQSGITDVKITRVRGHLTDHFDPRTNTLALSDGVYDSASLAALGIAAHEVGHVVQQQEGYAPLRLRSAFVPVANVASHAAVPLFFLGMLLSWQPLMWIGIGVFMAVVLFYLVMLPVEFNASSRAIAALESGGFLTYEEARPAKQVLSAAGLTYVAAALQAMLQLLRLLVIASGRRRRD
ncbi:MAG: zinc metallopeptidase [Oscillospiraceae bacterium]|jgi:Zn-dependent membrane protease YugP|nr:zinc metallopeptidase [Oscillospiraceae bacterium]